MLLETERLIIRPWKVADRDAFVAFTRDPQVMRYVHGGTPYEESEIEHETGHSFGLAHHCTGYAVMNNGASGCPDGYLGHFGSAPGYYATDRQGIDNVYP